MVTTVNSSENTRNLGIQGHNVTKHKSEEKWKHFQENMLQIIKYIYM